MADWTVQVSKRSQLYKNSFFELQLRMKLSPDIPSIRLDIGDPSSSEDFKPHPICTAILKAHTSNPKSAGLQDFRGDAEARAQVAKAYSVPDLELQADDVFFDYGCIGVVRTVLSLFCNPGDSILNASFGYPVINYLAESMRIEVKKYDLVQGGDWEPDFDSLERQVASNTKLLVVTNPSNPIGSVWNKDTLQRITQFAERHSLVILSDEVYETLSFSKAFISIGEISTSVPVICAKSLSKRFMVCGARVGWGLVYDRCKVLKSLPDTLKKLRIIELHPCSIAINATPQLIAEVPHEYYETLARQLKQRADFAYERASSIPAVTPLETHASMFMILDLDLSQLEGFSDAIDFAIKIAAEAGVSFMPGDLSGRPGCLRMFLCPKIEVINEGLDRLERYIRSHLRASS
jgi:tyrosine aminotransferase